MSLLYMVGGAATFRVTYGTVDNSYTFKLRDVSIGRRSTDRDRHDNRGRHDRTVARVDANARQVNP